MNKVHKMYHTRRISTWRLWVTSEGQYSGKITLPKENILEFRLVNTLVWPAKDWKLLGDSCENLVATQEVFGSSYIWWGFNLTSGDLPRNFDMENLVKKPLIDGQTFFVYHLSKLVDHMVMCSNDPLERTLTAPESDFFNLNDRSAEYVRLMNASEEVIQIDAKEEFNISPIIDRCSNGSIDRHPHTSNSWSSGKALEIELKQFPAGLKYALYNNYYVFIVNANSTSGELTLSLNKRHKYRHSRYLAWFMHA